MNREKLEELLKAVQKGTLNTDEALKTLETLPFSEMPFATIDHHRALRVGVPEVIYGEGKTPDQILGIAHVMLERGQSVLVTRVSEESAEQLQHMYPSAKCNALGRTVFIASGDTPPSLTKHYVAIVAAGTSDLPVVEEAYETLSALGNRVEKVVDVGVAGIHRLFAKLDVIRGARVVIVVAGMEGALASVVGGLVDKPVIAVPTSVGYGASFGGISALLTMLNSCSSGVTVVNIDNGFGAAYAASQMNHL